MTHIEKILKYLEVNKQASQKDLAEYLHTDVSRVSKLMRHLYESGKVNIAHTPGYSMKYSLKKDFEVIKSPNGNPLYLLYDPSFKGLSTSEQFDALLKTLVSDFIDGDVTPAKIRDVILPFLLRLTKLFEILAHASPGQVKATKQALIEYQGSNNET